MGAEQTSLNVGKNALSWILGHADVWYLLWKCADFVGNGGRYVSADGAPGNTLSVLENLLMLEEDHVDDADEEDDLEENQEYLEEEGRTRRFFDLRGKLIFY